MGAPEHFGADYFIRRGCGIRRAHEGTHVFAEVILHKTPRRQSKKTPRHDGQNQNSGDQTPQRQLQFRESESLLAAKSSSQRSPCSVQAGVVLPVIWSSSTLSLP